MELHGTSGFDQQPPAAAAQQEGNGNLHVVLVQELLLSVVIEEPVLMLAESGKDLSVRTGKGETGPAGSIEEILPALRKGNDLSVRSLADFRSPGILPQPVYRPGLAFKRGQGKERRPAV